MHQVKHEHVPVLLDAVLEYLSPKPGEAYLDLTAGYGGHARAIIGRTQAPTAATLVDRDAHAIAALAPLHEQGAGLVHSDFLSASQSLAEVGERYDLILADLGISSPHVDNSERGFAFQADGPLDMRMDQRQSLTAEVIVNEYPVEELARIIRQYGEEPLAKRVAQAIVEARPLHSTQSLADTIRAAMPKGGRIHPATRTFQGLRIAVNDELELLRASLPIWFSLLKPGGRLGVISFHSLEDRIVKQAFAEQAGDRYDAELRLLTKRPVTASQQEIVSNPRSRSARLRVAVKK